MTPDPDIQNPCKRLGEILLGEKVITEGQLAKALKKREEQGGFLGKALVELGYIAEPVLVNFLVKQFKIPHINLMDYEISEEPIKTVPKEICLKYNLLPIDKLGKILTIAMVDPLDTDALQKVKDVAPGLRIKPILCSWNDFEHVSRRVFPRDLEAEDDEESSAESFGLPSAPSKPVMKPPEVAPPLEEPVEVVPVVAVEESPSEGAPPTVGDGGFLEVVEDSVREAVQRAVNSVGDRVQEMIATANGNRGATGSELVSTIRRAMGDAMEEATGTLLFKTQQALEQATVKASDMTAEQMAELLRISMRQAIQDASADLVRQAAGNLGNAQKEN